MTHGPNSLETDSPARRIVNLLVRRGPMTIAELVVELGVTTTAVRQQVDRLTLEGWLVRGRRHGGAGRPAHVLSLSDKARRLFGQQADELGRLLVEEVVQMEGASRARELLQRVGHRMAERSRHAVGDGSPAERLVNLAGFMSDQGIQVETGRNDAGLKLTVYTCPYPELASDHREICDMERDAVSELVGSAVELQQCVHDGHHCCEFGLANAEENAEVRARNAEVRTQNAEARTQNAEAGTQNAGGWHDEPRP